MKVAYLFSASFFLAMYSDPDIGLVQRMGIDGENVVAPFPVPLDHAVRFQHANGFDTAFKDTWKGLATSVTRASLRESRSIIARRVVG
jgi:hypothetical protein